MNLQYLHSLVGILGYIYINSTQATGYPKQNRIILGVLSKGPSHHIGWEELRELGLLSMQDKASLHMGKKWSATWSL